MLNLRHSIPSMRLKRLVVAELMLSSCSPYCFCQFHMGKLRVVDVADYQGFYQSTEIFTGGGRRCKPETCGESNRM
ncbi:hypothetical protein GE09DRAFT_1136916 [Coniochaeta sp. 2T2.1]|nr:hypothetical protein GE09DRAFT_1136916 [Coniochaeta sp. 2T2.1]